MERVRQLSTELVGKPLRDLPFDVSRSCQAWPNRDNNRPCIQRLGIGIDQDIQLAIVWFSGSVADCPAEGCYDGISGIDVTQ